MSFHSSNPVISLKAVMKFNKLLAAGKAFGPPMPFHPPWKKTRIFPMMETAQSVESTQPTQGSDSSESGMVIDGIFFQTKEGKTTGEKDLSKQLHTHNTCQSNTSKNTDSSSDGKTSVLQENSDLEREPYGSVSNSQQSESKVQKNLHKSEDSFLNLYLDRCAVSSQSTYSNQQNVAYMTSFESDREQEISEESNSESSSEIDQDDSEGESKTHTEQDSETDTESETESGKESEDENISESEKEAETEDLSDCKVTGTQEFVRSVLWTMNETQPSKPRFTSSVAEISSTVGFNLTHDTYRISEETIHKGKDKNAENKKHSKKGGDSKTRNKDPKPLMGQEKEFSKNSKSQSKSSSSADSSCVQSNTDKGNLPPIAEDEEEEMTSAGSLRRNSLGNKFQGSASGTGCPEDEQEDSDTEDTVTAD